MSETFNRFTQTLFQSLILIAVPAAIIVGVYLLIMRSGDSRTLDVMQGAMEQNTEDIHGNAEKIRTNVSDIDANRNAIEANRGRIASAEKDIGRNAGRIDDNEKKISETDRKAEDAGNRTRDMERKLESLRAELETMNTAREQDAEKIGKLEKEIAALRDRLGDGLSGLKDRLDHLEKMLRESGNTN